MLEEASQFKGGRKDVDKEVEQMTEEEKAIFDVLDNANIHNHNEVTIGVEGKYEELDDDFILMLNGGVPALELIEKGDNKHKEEMNEAHDNKGVIVLED